MKNNLKQKIVIVCLIIVSTLGNIWGDTTKQLYKESSKDQFIKKDETVVKNETKKPIKVQFKKIEVSEAIKLSELEQKPIFILFNFNDTIENENQDTILATNDTLIALINSHFINIQLNKQEIDAEKLKAKLKFSENTKYLFWNPSDSSILELNSDDSYGIFLEFSYSVAHHKKYYNLLFTEPDNQNYLYKTYGFMNKTETEKVKELIDSVNVATINSNDTITRYEFFNNCYWAQLDWKSQTYNVLLNAKNVQKANLFFEVDTVSNFAMETISLYAYFLTTNIPYIDYQTNEAVWKEYESKMDLLLAATTIDVQDFIDEYFYYLFNRVDTTNLIQFNQFLEKLAVKFNAGNYCVSKSRLFNLLFWANYELNYQMLYSMLKNQVVYPKTAYHQLQFAQLLKYKKQTEQAINIEKAVRKTLGKKKYNQLQLLVTNDFKEVLKSWQEQ
jgi:hypothetical protein